MGIAMSCDSCSFVEPDVVVSRFPCRTCCQQRVEVEARLEGGFAKREVAIWFGQIATRDQARSRPAVLATSPVMCADVAEIIPHRRNFRTRHDMKRRCGFASATASNDDFLSGQGSLYPPWESGQLAIAIRD